MNEQITSLQRRDEDAALAHSHGAIEIAQSRVAQEVQAAMVVAKKYPRNERDAMARIEQACCRPRMAAKAQYHFPRGNEEISGISIRLAEVLARSWGNIDFGTVEIEQRNGESMMMAYCWDLETNVRATRLFVVPHVREKKGRSGLEQIALESTRDIYEVTANMGARRERACILQVIPADIQEEAVEMCNRTLQADFTEEKRDKMVAAFADSFNVTVEQLETFIGRRVKNFDGGTYVRLRRVYQTLQDGFGAVADFFPPTADPNAKPRGKFGFNKDKQETPPADEQDTPVSSAAVDTDESPEGTMEGAAQQESYVFHCNKCGRNFDNAVLKKYRGKLTNHCLCGSRDLDSWEDWVRTQEPTESEETIDAPVGVWMCADGHDFSEPVDGACPTCRSKSIEQLEPAEA